jgi:DNA-binding NarL/FixJ family response regulator
MTNSVIRVLVVDDHPVVRKGTCALLAEIDDIDAVGEASDGAAAVEQIALLQPDVVLMDLVMPGLEGTDAIREISSRWPETRILVLTNVSEEDKALAAFEAGAVGYLTKEADPLDLVRAIRDVYKGASPIQPSVAQKILLEWTGRKQDRSHVEALTNREKEVLSLMAAGLLDSEISELLHIGEVTVRTHVNHVLGKLAAATRVQAVLWAVREGLVPQASQEVPYGRPNIR